MVRKKRSKIWDIPRADIEQALRSSNVSLRQILISLGFSGVGGSIRTLKTRMAEEGIDFSHISLGRGSNRGRTYATGKWIASNVVPLAQVLTVDSSFKRGALKRRLIRSGLLVEVCSICKLPDEWQEKKASSCIRPYKRDTERQQARKSKTSLP